MSKAHFEAMEKSTQAKKDSEVMKQRARWSWARLSSGTLLALCATSLPTEKESANPTDKMNEHGKRKEHDEMDILQERKLRELARTTSEK